MSLSNNLAFSAHSRKNARQKGLTIFMAQHAGHGLTVSMIKLIIYSYLIASMADILEALIAG